MLKTRVLSAVIGIPIIAFFLIARGYYLYFFIFALTCISLREYTKAMQSKQIHIYEYILYLMAGAYFMVLLEKQGEIYLGILISLFVMVMLSYEIIRHKHSFASIVYSLFGFVYITFLFSHIALLNEMENAAVIIWLPFVTAWFADTAAYFVGISIGKHKLCPEVSPKKTIEGAIGGIVGCGVLSILFGVAVNSFGINIPLYHYAAIGLLCGFTSILGDLAASYIKRFCGIKDFGNLIPGHGGILDRFDSIMFTAPTIYYYFMFVKNML